MRYAKIENGAVANIVSASPSWVAEQPGQWTAATDEADIGWSWDGVAFAPPSNAARAAGLVLRRAAFLMAIDAALDLANAPGAPDPEDHVIQAVASSGAALGAGKRAAMLLVRHAGEFWRDDPAAPGLMNAVGGLLGLTPAQIDALFIAAAG